MAKVRRIDYSADEFLTGTMTLSDLELGIYWRACSLIYSHGGPVPLIELRRWSSSRKGLFDIVLARLVTLGKLTRNRDEIGQNRAEREIERATKRAETWKDNGTNGGRPARKNNEVDKPGGLGENNRASNYQLSTTNDQQDRGEEPPMTPAQTGADDGSRPSRRKPRTAFAADWLPDEQDTRFAHGEGRDDGWIGREGPRCRDHHIGKGNLFADFHAAWRTWVRNATGFELGGSSTSGRSGAGGSSHSRIAAALDRVHLDPKVSGPH